MKKATYINFKIFTSGKTNALLLLFTQANVWPEIWANSHHAMSWESTEIIESTDGNTTTCCHLFHPHRDFALWLTRFFSTLIVDINSTPLPDEMLKMTSCWIQPIHRTHLFWISFWIRFRLSIFRSIFICVELDASVFLAVWVTAVATDYFEAPWARGGFNVIIGKVFFFPKTLLHIDFFLTVPAVSVMQIQNVLD